MIIEKRNKIYEIKNDYIYIVLTIVITSLISIITIAFEQEIYNALSVVNFLTWHIIMEFTSIIFTFIIFNNCYYSYKHTKRMRLLVLAATFFVVGCLDFMHMLFYEGMPTTFAISSVERTTAYWIIARLVMALGIFIASYMPFFKKTTIDENIIILSGILITLIFFYLVTYKLDILPPLFIKGKGLTQLKIYLEYVIMFMQVAAIIKSIDSYRKFTSRYLLVLSIGLIVLIFSEAFFTFNKCTNNTFNMIGHLYKVIGFYLIYHSIYKYNIDLPYIKLKEAQKKIGLYANNLEKLVDIRTNEFKEANDTLNKELDYAKVIQQSLLPPSRLEFENVVFVSNYIPCEKLSGDFYDIFEIDKDNIGMYILDVTGHGVPASLLTMFSINNIKSNERLIKRYRGLKPHKNLSHFYQEFNKLNFPEEMHIVTFFATYNKSSKVLTYCTAGMNCYPILIRKTGEYEFLDKSQGFPICQLSDFFIPEYISAKIQLEQGDKIIFYTDGLTDKQKNSAINYRELIDIILKNCNKNIMELNNDLLKQLRKSNKRFDDDITYFIMEVL